MGPPKQKKKAPAQEPKAVHRDNEFRMEPDLRNPWEAEDRATLALVPKKEPGREGKVQTEKAPKNKEEPLSELAKGEGNFGNRIKALRARMEERDSKYNRGNPSTRPRETKSRPPQYLDRLSRFGSRWGNRPKNTELENTQKETKKKKKG